MKKFFALSALLCVICTVSAQKVKETVTVYDKQQLTGFTINIDDANAKIVTEALSGKFDSQYGMRGNNKKGFRVYENQPCEAFGDSRYDVYFTTADIGKKNNKTTQLTLVVSTGNMNCVTYANDPRTANNIVNFLETVPAVVEAYKKVLRIKELNIEIARLQKERESLTKNQTKVKEKIAKATEESRKTSEQLEAQNKRLAELQERFNQSHEAEVKEKITSVIKEKKVLQKAHTNAEKSLIQLNQEIVKLNEKLEKNAKEIKACEAELKTLQ